MSVEAAPRPRSLTDREQEMLQATGFVSIVDSGRTVTLTREDMPWLSGDEKKVHLATGTLLSGEEVLLGSAIVGSLVDEVEGATRKANPDITNKQFLRSVIAAFTHEAGVAPVAIDSIPHTLYATRNPQRKSGSGGLEQSNSRHVTTYIMRLAEKKTPTFIRVALTSEAGNKRVQRALT